MNNFKVLRQFMKRNSIFVVLLFLAFVFTPPSRGTFFALPALQAEEEAGVELPQFEEGQAPEGEMVAAEGDEGVAEGEVPPEEEEEELEPVQYRTFFGLNPRDIVWIVSELHLMFAAFVLGVPMFAVLVEVIGFKGGDIKYDNMAREFTKLLSAAFATTASLGGLLAFCLFGLYPEFMGHMTNVFSSTMYIYALMFFAEAFCLYGYYYSWDVLKGTALKKWSHITLGVMLNLFGTALMFLTNSWATYMMGPAGVSMKTGRLLSLHDAFMNPLWMPVNIHRLIANVCFGGFVVGAYSAVKFLNARTEEEKAHYDWMGYVGNFIGIGGLIPLPFAGYWLGREIYSVSPVMGNIMMGGAFSWTFIIQAVLIGMLFIGANYYLWLGMGRIKGSERYTKYIKYLTMIIFFGFAVWLTPHNLPLSGEERAMIGEQYHPFSKYFGVMAAKNAVVNLIILATFFSFLIYRRSNLGQTVPFAEQGKFGKIGIFSGVIFCLFMLVSYAVSLNFVKLDANVVGYVKPLIKVLYLQSFMICLAGYLTFKNKGKMAQILLFISAASIAVVYFWFYGFLVMQKANLVLRYLSVTQVAIVMSCLIMNATIDVVIFRKAKVVGGIVWGKMPVRSQYALLMLCVVIVILMGLMGFIRSGLRMDWHVYGLMQDTSQWAFTPTLAYMGRVVGLIVALFLGLVAFVFWLAGLGDKKKKAAEA
ncbi:MAG: cytochrome ubiquinol oxidase subunit I [Candidatus Brocadiaceae bacterium]|nr:cytochrome ubiquinol oxidase subunit I [Candidatus Brocadiaceae bacterium]